MHGYVSYRKGTTLHVIIDRSLLHVVLAHQAYMHGGHIYES